MTALSSWALARAAKLFDARDTRVDPGRVVSFGWHALARELDKARELGKQDAVRVLNKAAQEFEQKGEEGLAFACRSVGKYVKATT